MRVFLIGLASVVGFQPHALGRQWAYASYFSLIKEASDILIVRVARIEGREYGEKAVASVERVLKGEMKQDSIELPFVYKSWRGENNTFVTESEVMPVSFEQGKRYLVMLIKGHRKAFNPFSAQTEYQVINYPKRTFFEISDDNDPHLKEVRRLLTIGKDTEESRRVDSLLVLLKSDSSDVRSDAIEALVDLKAEKATDTFIAVLRSDPNANVRYWAARALGYPHSEKILEVLLECLRKEKVGYVRYQLVRTLCARNAKTQLPMLLERYEREEYDVRNAILGTASIMGDSTNVRRLIHLFMLDGDPQHRHQIARIIARFHSSEADEFSSALLDTAERFWYKTAVMDGWSSSAYVKGFDRIARWTSVPCASQDARSRADTQFLALSLVRAVGKLGSPQQIASTLKIYSSCEDNAIRQQAVRILKEQLSKDLSAQLSRTIEEEIQAFGSP